MAKVNSIQLQGFQQYLRVLQNAPKALQSEAKAVIRDAADLWEDLAETKAPRDQGRLAGAITNKEIKDGYEVFVNVEYAPFIEWGTKTRVQVPSDLRAYAAQFQGAKGGGNAKRVIYDWCKRVGIPVERWFLVYRSIMTYGIKPQPFFFVQRPAVQRQLLTDLKRLVDSL